MADPGKFIEIIENEPDTIPMTEDIPIENVPELVPVPVRR